VEILADSYTAPFRLERWDGARAVEYRVAYDLRTNSGVDTRYYAGRIPAEPDGTRPLVLAAFTGTKHHTGEPIAWNHSSIWFPHTELVSAVRYHRPDLLFFSGDQLYEGDLTGAQREPLDAAILDYLDKWYRWCWAFEELTRDVPCVAIPDDHDVYHGNIWGAGGRHAERPDDGGYTMPARFINAVQRTQTSHLPDPIDPEPVEQGIGVYFTEMIYGGVCFAIIEDRKFKSSPTALIPDGKVVNGFFQNPAFDPATQADVPGAQLLGERQIRFLHDWAERTEAAAKMKAVLSQTIFSNVSTLPRDFTSDQGTPGLPPTDPDALSEDYRLIADADSNGWPQSGRNAALREMRRASAVHICGDQHLGIVIRYGMDAWNDGPYAFCVPSIANTWPRRWYPPTEGANREPGSPPYTGEYRDAFGNRMTVLAAANPTRSGHEPAALYDRAPGYGVIRFDTENGWVRFECWPRWIDPREAEARQYPGWPITVVPGES
jgi:phosphodiesterase/alkaline phosphatase D-like protein